MALPVAEKAEESEATSASAGPINPPEAELRGCNCVIDALPVVEVATAVLECGEWVEPVVPNAVLSWADDDPDSRERVEVRVSPASSAVSSEITTPNLAYPSTFLIQIYHSWISAS